jgi:PAS domain S-box-containing protein
VRLQGVVTFAFSTSSCFVQDKSAGIYVGNGAEFGALVVGDVVVIEGVSSPGEYAPIVRPLTVRVLGRTTLPGARRVSFEDLVTGHEDSQWVEVVGLVRTVLADTTNFQTLEIATGGGRLSVFIPGSVETNLAQLVDSQVRVRGVCGTWFNRLRQLFGVRLMVPRVEDILVEEMPPRNALAQPAQPIGNLLRFAPQASFGHRVKVTGTVVCQQPGRAIFVQDEQHGLYVQTRQFGNLQPGDRVELLGFPVKGEYTPMLQDAVWQKVSSGPEPAPAWVWPDEALGGLHDCRLVSIEGRLLNRSHNNRETVLVLEADGSAFSAHLDSGDAELGLSALQNHSRLRLTGVCRIEVGEDWRAGPDWRAKSFRIVLRTPADVKVVSLPPWWTLARLLWAVGILVALVAVSFTWAAMLNRKVGQQTEIIRKQLALEATLRERYQDLFENANDMVYTHDLGGRMTSVNMAGERLLGRDRAGINQVNLLEFIAEEQRLAAGKWLECIVDGTAPTTVEWDFVPASGERVRLEISTRLIDREGRRVEVEGIARDVTERRRLEREILEISTREQRRIGHDLHDGVCQQLAGIAFLSDILADKLDEQRRPETAEARKITELVHKANAQTRGVARGLFPVRIEENGLASALEELAENAGAFFNVRCEFFCEAPVAIRDHAVAHHFYYIAQEAILNAVKHGKARLIEVRFAPAEGGGCTLAIRDNGVGFGPMETPARGMGIRIMKYRARMIGADLQVRTGAGGGVEVLCQSVVESRKGN